MGRPAGSGHSGYHAPTCNCVSCVAWRFGYEEGRQVSRGRDVTPGTLDTNNSARLQPRRPRYGRSCGCNPCLDKRRGNLPNAIETLDCSCKWCVQLVSPSGAREDGTPWMVKQKWRRLIGLWLALALLAAGVGSIIYIAASAGKAIVQRTQTSSAPTSDAVPSQVSNLPTVEPSAAAPPSALVTPTPPVPSPTVFLTATVSPPPPTATPPSVLVNPTSPVPSPTAGQAATASPPPPTSSPDLEQLRQYMLDLINADRAKAGVGPVAMGSNTAAQQHAEDMLKNFYLGHIDSGGMKPYMRYTLAGGLGASGENAGYSGTQDPSDRRNYRSIDPKRHLAEHEYAMMYDDAFSNWGHRDNIIEAQHQFVNIGIAYDRTRLTFSQQFEERYVNFSTPPKLDNGNLILAGSLDPSVGKLQSIDVYYDPPPSGFTHGQLLAQPRSYSVGTSDRPTIHIIAPAPRGSSYVGLLSTDVIATYWSATGNAFLVTANVAAKVSQSGVYTLLLWTDQGKFPLTTISLFVP